MRHESKAGVTAYRALFSMAHQILQGTLGGVTSAVGRWEPNGTVAPIEAQYVHMAASEDYLVNVLVRGSVPLCATMFAGRTGWQGEVPVTDWNTWARTAEIDLLQVMNYARLVFGATEYFLSQADDLLLERTCDASMLGMGTLPAAEVLNLALCNLFLHTGEISCLKGLLGMVGYPETAHAAPTENILSDAELAALFD